MEKQQIKDNDMKWASISLLLNNIKLLSKRENYEKINELLFKTSFAASCKYDGTNVGKDDMGTKYGRNQTIVSNSYQKCNLEQLEKLDVKKIKEDLLTLTGIPAEKIERFNLYGELMCNKGLYDYAQTKVGGTHQLFGAIIKPIDFKSTLEIAEKLGKAKFACNIRRDHIDENDENKNEGQLVEDNSKNQPANLINIFMNETFKDLIAKNDYPHVPFMSHFENFYDLAVKNFEFLHGGYGEGLVVVSPADGQNCVASKWKNGLEASGDNMGTINKILILLEGEEAKIFGENSKRLKELCEMFLKIEKSRLICGKEKVEEKKNEKGKKEGAGKGKAIVEISVEESKIYEEAIKSAKTKFDHEDTFFAKGAKGSNEFSELIAKECLNDVVIKDGDVDAMKRHNEIVAQLIKEDFISYNRNKKGKK